uniref:EF-hand domain-containing protein n=1 Tax=Pyramimonas obovata TaxID=1411642 RepID=A0A7S0MUP3_9CHLO|mmetsp:Transcript_13864/g.29610  ORF Transcript_13864/g.29610 Transcript_13864/m.29610 type:complete len:487 (+) Transcript_13864:255-1715(+)|eukprot:CAMPEP_0118928078 /NCGR_PEP_ID=MMETSP1169-20130426/5415_1 /TAXON_ID=36882 /ORGANISM="Pyramimonas obovata, Strain CCMP722" /LENGTH=486 /DNA_ID=CAMNT_0006869977 /DNA_START=203 /DNA_END=1663 /DNA_ORIENTATION=-
MEALANVDTLVLFACYDEDQDFRLNPLEFGDVLRELGVTSFFSYNKAQTFINGQFESADSNGDGKVSLLEFERFFPGLLTHAKSQGMKLELPERLADPEYIEFAKQQRAKLEQSREDEKKVPQKEVTVVSDKNGKVKVTQEGAFLLKKIRPKIDEARQAKQKLEAKLKEVMEKKAKLEKHGNEFKNKKEMELGVMEARLAELQGKRNEAKLAREQKMERAKVTLEEAEAKVRSIPTRDLQELKKMVRPPESVKRSLEAVYLLLEPAGAAEEAIKSTKPHHHAGFKGAAAKVGAKTSVASAALAVHHAATPSKPLDFEKVLSRMSKPDFLESVTKFRVVKNSSEAVVTHLKQQYTSDPKLSEEAVSRGSKAAAQLWQWVTAQVKVAPLAFACEKAANTEEEKNWQVEIQQLLKDIAMFKLSRMDKQLKVTDLKVDNVAAQNKQNLKKTEAHVAQLEADIAAMQGVIEKGTKVERHILAGGDVRELAF